MEKIKILFETLEDGSDLVQWSTDRSGLFYGLSRLVDEAAKCTEMKVQDFLDILKGGIDYIREQEIKDNDEG